MLNYYLTLPVHICFFFLYYYYYFSKHINMLIVFFEREDVDRRQFCRCIIGVSGVPRGPYCMCKTKMAACALRIKCCVLESCCSFDGGFPSRSTRSCWINSAKQNHMHSPWSTSPVRNIPRSTRSLKKLIHHVRRLRRRWAHQASIL